MIRLPFRRRRVQRVVVELPFDHPFAPLIAGIHQLLAEQARPRTGPLVDTPQVRTQDGAA